MISSNRVKMWHLVLVEAKLAKANVRWGQPNKATLW